MNRFTEDENADNEVLKVDPALERSQVERLKAWQSNGPTACSATSNA